MATILSTQNGKFKAIIRNAKGRYLRSKTFTRKTDARTWARRMEADQEAMEAVHGEFAIQAVIGSSNSPRQCFFHR
jgi:hypothetical protein